MNTIDQTSLKPVLLQAKRKPVQGYRQVYIDTEQAAIKDAGFEVLELESGIFGLTKQPEYQLKGRPVFCRHYANEDNYFTPYVKQQGGRLVVPGYASAKNWYKTLPLEFLTRDFMGGRRMAWYPLAPYGFLEEDGQDKALRELIDTVYEKYAINGKLFAKSETKNSFTAKLYTKIGLYDTLSFLLGVGCHRAPRDLIVSQPIDIVRPDTDYKLEEYRCLIVGGRVSTISLYTDKKGYRDYSEIKTFANRFAHTFTAELPNSYDLDVARLTNGKLAIVEINDIAACGFFADHDLDKLFKDIHTLAKKIRGSIEQTQPL